MMHSCLGAPDLQIPARTDAAIRLHPTLLCRPPPLHGAHVPGSKHPAAVPNPQKRGFSACCSHSAAQGATAGREKHT